MQPLGKLHRSRTLETLVALLLFSAVVHCGEPSTKLQRIYDVELSQSGGIPVVQLTFFVDVTPEKALEYLRIQLATAARFNPSKETMAYAWRENQTERGKGNEKPVLLPDGSKALLLKDGKYLTGKEAKLIGE